MNLFNKFFATLLLSTAPQAFSETQVYDFENGDTLGWTAQNVFAGPWSSNEWAVSGTSSLKADIQLSNDERYYLKLTEDVDLENADFISASLKTSDWGYFAEGTSAKLYVKTGEGWTWFSSEPILLADGEQGTELFLALRQVSSLDQVREIGVELYSAPGSSGQAAIYLDNVNINLSDKAQRTALWSLPSGYTTFDKEGNPYIQRDGGFEKLAFYSGEVLWRYDYAGTGGYYIDNSDALYVVDNQQFKKINKDNAGVVWEMPVDSDYISLLEGFDNRLYIQSGDSLRAIDRSQGQEAWRYTLSGYTKIEFINADLMILCANNQITAISTANAQVIWQYTSEGHPFINVSESGDIFVRNGTNHDILRKINSENGEEVWKFDNGNFVDNPQFDSDNLMYFVSGGYFDRVVTALDRNTGELQWKTAPREFFNTLYAANDQLVIVRGSTVLGINNTNGSQAWQYDNARASIDAQGNFFVTVENAATPSVSKVDIKTGAILWQRNNVKLATQHPISLNADSTLLKLSTSLMKVDNQSGDIKWQFTVGDHYKLLGFDEWHVYISPTPNRVVAINLTSGKRDWYIDVDNPVHFKFSLSQIAYFEYDSTSESPAPYGLVAVEKFFNPPR